jgi:hypothetical protein
VVITGHNANTVFYGVSLDAGKTAFTVPVKVANGQLQKPDVLICNGSITSFDAVGLQTLIKQNHTDSKVAAVASAVSHLRPVELVEQVKQAIAESNPTKAEDALNVLAHCGDERAHKTAFNLYLQSLAGKEATQTKCVHAMQHKHSQHPICGQTGLPLHKVYQDKEGNCRPLYRQTMSETSQGLGTFAMNYRSSGNS